MFSINKKQLLASFAIGLTSYIGDKNAENFDSPFLLAINDNMTHALIGALTWIGAFISKISKTDAYFVFEVLLCAISSSIIDLDHFISAKSLNLKNATSLKNRPFLHCSTLAIVVVFSILLFSYYYKINWLHKFGWILATAFISHHIRDGKRRGFWLWPFGHTKPISNFVHLGSQIFLPQVIEFVHNWLAFESGKSGWLSGAEIV